MDLPDLASVFALQTLSTDHRAIRLRMAHGQHLLDRVLLAQRVAVTEGVCDGLTANITCLSTRDNLPLESFIGLPIDVQLVTDRGALRSFCAIVTTVQQGQSDGSLTAIHLTARDALALLEQRINFRVFRDKSVLDLARLLLDEWRQRSPALARSFDYRLLNIDESRYPKRAFCLQANESDAHFLRRLLRRNGIAWCFRACPADDDTPRHELVLFDDGLQLPQNASGEVRYHRRDGTEKADTVHLLAPAAHLIRGAVMRRSYDHETASVHEAVETSALSQGEIGTELAAALVDARIEMPHAGDSHADHQRLTRLAMQHHEFTAHCLHGAGSVRTFAAGEWTRIAGHAGLDTVDDHEREFVVVRVEHQCENNLPKDLNERVQALLGAPAAPTRQEVRDDGEHRYGNTFIAVRRGTPIVPAWDPYTDLPRLPTLTAVVVGPQGEAVWCDELGRVKVRFLGLDPADHAHAQGAGTNGDDGDSAWVRVDFGWAGNGFGVLFPLRAGMDVDICFAGGDLDRPMITGCRYNARNRPPRFGATGEVNDNRYLSGIRTQEVRGNRHNQLRFDDTPGQISVQLGSEHAHSEIRLGYLTDPREYGVGEPCGEGIAASTGAAAAIRAAQGLLLCAEARPGGTGRQLAREELLACLDAARELTQTLAEAAQQALGDRLDARPQRRLQAAIENWEGGSNTQPQGADGQQPVVAVSAAAGLALTTPSSTTLYTGENLDIASQGDTQQTTGRRWLVNVGATISWFAAGVSDLVKQTAAAVAVKLIAARGNILLQAQSGAVELQARRDIVLGALGHVSINAQGGITLTEQGGAQIELTGGNVTVKCPGQYTVQAAGFSFSGPGGGVPLLPALPGQAALHDWLGLAYLEPDTGSPVDAAPYEVGYDNGITMEGTLNTRGTARHDSVPDAKVREVVYRPREPAPEPAGPGVEALQ